MRGSTSPEGSEGSRGWFYQGRCPIFGAAIRQCGQQRQMFQGGPTRECAPYLSRSAIFLLSCSGSPQLFMLPSMASSRPTPVHHHLQAAIGSCIVILVESRVAASNLLHRLLTAVCCWIVHLCSMTGSHSLPSQKVEDSLRLLQSLNKPQSREARNSYLATGFAP